MDSKDFSEKIKAMLRIVDEKDFPRIAGRASFFARAYNAIRFVETHRVEGALNDLIFKEITSMFNELNERSAKND